MSIDSERGPGQLNYCEVWLTRACGSSGKQKDCMCLIKDMRLWSITMPTNIWAHGRLQAHACTVHVLYIDVGPGCFAVFVGGLSNPIEP